MPEFQPQTAPVTPANPSSVPSARDEASGTEALAHLAKMSGTGSTFGAADYVAINPTAVAALLIGFAGALSLLVGIFLFLPIISIGCGLLAIRQIRNSNGTQGGYSFALAGMLISLLIGGVVGTREAREWMNVRAQTNAVATMIAKFGEDVRAGNYDHAYETYTTEEFRTRFDLATFRRTFEELQHMPGFGPIESFGWNQEAMVIENIADIETRVTFMALAKCRDLKEPAREFIRVTNKDGTWRIESMPGFFPEKAPSNKF